MPAAGAAIGAAAEDDGGGGAGEADAVGCAAVNPTTYARRRANGQCGYCGAESDKAACRPCQRKRAGEYRQFEAVGERIQPDVTLGEVANALGLTRERVRQIETAAVRKVARSLSRLLGETVEPARAREMIAFALAVEMGVIQ